MLLDPVVGEHFFGRSAILATLDKRVHALKKGYRQNIAITGHRLTGKSSVLSHFLSTFKDPRIISVYLEVMPEPFREFAKKFVGTLLYNFLKYNDKELRDDMDFLIRECRHYLPDTIAHVEQIFRLIDKGESESAYSELLNLTSMFKSESKSACIVILDEFHNLSRLGVREPFRAFGKKIMTQKDTMYIVASSEMNSIQKILSEKLALLFGNFEKITLGGFDKDTSRAFLRRKITSAAIPDPLLDFLITFADGHPFYLDVISRKINDISGAERIEHVDTQMIARVLEEVLFDGRGTLNQFYTNMLREVLGQDNERSRETLIALAHSQHRQSDIAVWTGFTAREVSRHLKLLTEANLIYQCGMLYRFYDKVLRFWLCTVYHKRRRTLVDNIFDKARHFRDEMCMLIEDFVKESAMHPVIRVKNLFDSFNNEIVKLGTKRQKLPRFTHTEVATHNGRQYIIARYQNKIRVALFSESAPDENDIVELVTYSSRFKPLLQRRMILALEEMDINTVLMAKEMKVLIWGPETVDEVFDIYRKHSMVVRRSREKK